LLAFILILFSAVSLLVKVVAVLFCIASYVVNEIARKQLSLVNSFTVNDADFSLVLDSGEAWHGSLEGTVLSMPFLIILFLRGAEKIGHKKNGHRKKGQPKRKLVLFRDTMNKEDWRRLRVYLRTASFESPKVQKQ